MTLLSGFLQELCYQEGIEFDHGAFNPVLYAMTNKQYVNSSQMQVSMDSGQADDLLADDSYFLHPRSENSPPTVDLIYFSSFIIKLCSIGFEISRTSK